MAPVCVKYSVVFCLGSIRVEGVFPYWPELVVREFLGDWVAYFYNTLCFYLFAINTPGVSKPAVLFCLPTLYI